MEITYCAHCNRVLYEKDANPETGKCPDCQAGRSTLPAYLNLPNPFREGGSVEGKPLQPAQ